MNAAILVSGQSLVQNDGEWRLNPQHHLGDDVALDLVRPAVNRRLARVEIGRRGAVGVIGADGVLVVAFTKAAEIRRAIMADRFQCEFGNPLLDFASP